MSWERESYYYSGQGVLLVAERTPAGLPMGFMPVGNCPAATINIETTVEEHKESQSGQRAVDKRLTTETNARISITLENFEADVLALALRGARTIVRGASVTAEALTLYNGRVLRLRRIEVSAVTLRRGATTLTPFVNDATPYDYKINLRAGSIQMNSGAVTPIAALTTGGVAPTAITVGANTTITVANSASAGQSVAFTGFAGADAGLINGRSHRIVSATPTQVVIDRDTTGRVITLGTPLSAFDGAAMSCDYTHAEQFQVDALTAPAEERFLRFEGLNTQDNNRPVVIEAFRFVVDPASALPLISDDVVAQYTLEGALLSDPLQTVGSKIFRETALR